jgi:hypothetical protein
MFKKIVSICVIVIIMGLVSSSPIPQSKFSVLMKKLPGALLAGGAFAAADTAMDHIVPSKQLVVHVPTPVNPAVPVTIPAPIPVPVYPDMHGEFDHYPLQFGPRFPHNTQEGRLRRLSAPVITGKPDDTILYVSISTLSVFAVLSVVSLYLKYCRKQKSNRPDQFLIQAPSARVTAELPSGNNVSATSVRRS